MKWLAKTFYYVLLFRYDIKVKGLPNFSKEMSYLVLPNHIAYIDPVLIWCILRPHILLKPVVTSDFAKNPALSRIFNLMGTISIQEFDGTAKGKEEEKIKNALGNLSQSLNDGDSVLLYPSGMLRGQGKEYIGGKKSAYLTVQSLGKDSRVLGVRTTGLWGSRWSNAWNGKTPLFGGNLLKSLWWFIANLFFFAPKREVVIEFEDITDEIKPYSKKTVEEFNHYLEEFYNKNGEEPVNYVPYYFYFDDVKDRTLPKKIRNSIATLQEHKEYDESLFSQEVIDDIKGKIRDIKDLQGNQEILLSSNLVLDLYFDSLDMSEMKNLILNTYSSASNTSLSELKTVSDLVAMAMGLSENETVIFPECNWNIDPKMSKTHKWSLKSDSILELFRNEWKKDKNASQVYDAMFGLQTRKDVVLKAFLISEYLKHFEGKYLGVMLPALSSTSLIVLATYLAEKVPVMMNWTHPESAFDHCVKFSKTNKILTSKTFFDKIRIDWLKKYDFVFLEDLLKKIPLTYKIKALVKSLYFPLPKKLDDVAVVLYTSGSESLPKAVPLTHKNLIAELKGALDIINIHNDEIFFCYLPPFHSFGFTVNTIFPLIGGMRSVNTPDPNDSLTVAKLIEHSKPTILATTPTFLKNLLSVAKKEQLQCLRYVITGGEKCSDVVFKKFKDLLPKGVILEGYGITECAPIISINTIEKQKTGSVGVSIGGGVIKILDIETNKELGAKKEGMIYYSGPNVFRGYEDKNLDSPFWKNGRKVWYKTGDLGFLDKDGYLFITGRMKRFLKLGGEMISLPYVEEILQEKYGNTDTLNLAVEGKELQDGIKIVMFVVDEDIKVEDVNRYLQSKGVSSIIQINEVKKIDEIPLLGTGKIDYKVLKAMID